MRALTSTGEINAEYARQYGPWLLLRRHELSFVAAPGVEYRVRDVRYSAPGWSARFEQHAPDDYWFHPQSDALALIWTANSAGGRDRLRQDPALRKTIDMGDLAGDYVIELMDAATGKLRGRRVLETGRGSSVCWACSPEAIGCWSATRSIASSSIRCRQASSKGTYSVRTRSSRRMGGDSPSPREPDVWPCSRWTPSPA
jgi:hypothetical protein